MQYYDKDFTSEEANNAKDTAVYQSLVITKWLQTRV